jgi:hypothetical protein
MVSGAVRRRLSAGVRSAKRIQRPHWMRHHALRYVFVVTYGRSGSTLVQGLLNALPGALIRGENNFFILPLYRSMVLARAFKHNYGGPVSARARSAFYGVHELRPDKFATRTRELVVDQLLGRTKRSLVDVIGFKEIRWHSIKPAEQADFFDFMDTAFPGARYVLNQRDHGDVRTSDFWRGTSPEEFVRVVTRTEQIQDYLRATRPDRVYDTRYEVLTGEDDVAAERQLRGLAEFVTGSCDEAALAEMRRTMRIGHGPHPFVASQRRRNEQRSAEGQ